MVGQHFRDFGSCQDLTISHSPKKWKPECSERWHWHRNILPLARTLAVRGPRIN